MRFALTLSLLLATACSDDPTPTEVWEPSDHVQPPRQAVDPSRVPREGRPGARGPGPREPGPQGEERIAAAATLWRISCAGCHGAEGHGDGEAYDGELADLADPEWQASVTDEQIARVITLGQPPMPAYGEVLAPAGIVALVEQVRRFGAAPEAGPEAAPDTAPAQSDGDAEASPESPTES